VRSSNPENKTKEAIVSAALKLFLTNGYEGTSVRMILNEADVVTGSFYHFFKTKEDLFEEVINRFMAFHAAQIAETAAGDSLPIAKQLEAILGIIEQNTVLYTEKLQAGQLHWTVQAALLERTLQAILPTAEAMIAKALENGTARNVTGMDIHTLSAVVLQGIKGIIHSAPSENADSERAAQVRKDVMAYISHILCVDFGAE